MPPYEPCFTTVFKPIDYTTIYAQWTPITYKITYNLYGGTVSPANPESYTIETDTFTLNNPTKTDSTFTGWTGTNVYPAQTTVTIAKGSTGDKLYSANWTLTTYTITFDGNGGTVRMENYTTVPKDLVLMIFYGSYAPTRYGYTFAGWYTAATGGEMLTDRTRFNKDTTVYAQWTLNTYSVFFELYRLNGEPVGQGQGVQHGYKLTEPEAPTRTGYTFSGWYKEIAYNTQWNFDTDTVTSGGMSLYAKWDFVQYAITFDANGGTVTPASGTTGDEWKLTSLPTPTRDGYRFNGWFTEKTGDEVVTTSTAFSADTTIYAQWIPIYTITFNANGGTVDPTTDTTGTDWTLASLPTPTRDGYLFGGWYAEETGGEAVTTSTVFDANTTVYAQWIITYTVTFNANGGTVDPTTGTTGTGWTLASLPTPIKSGYSFTGWYTEETGGTKVTTSTVFSAAITIYAQWFETTFTDSRDGMVYRRVKIGTQVWMAENLNYNVPNVTTDVCYGNSADSCAKYGRLYLWPTAMEACPVGWHLPSDAEWTTLTNYVGGASTAGTKLKSTSGWNNYQENGNGTDEYGFSALPGGYGERTVIDGIGPFFSYVGDYGSWWSATKYDESNENQVWHRGMGNYTSIQIDKYSYQLHLRSVRCVQD